MLDHNVTSLFSMCVVDNVIALSCDWIVIYFQTIEMVKYDMLPYDAQAWLNSKVFKLNFRKNKNNSEKILWSNNGQLINGRDFNNLILFWKQKLEA